MEYIEELKYLENKEKEKKEKARKRAKEHYYKYKETHLKAQKKWKENNPEKVKEYEKKRYEKRKQLKQENERLNNIINELEKGLEDRIKLRPFENLDMLFAYKRVLEMIKELKGSDKEWEIKS